MQPREYSYTRHYRYHFSNEKHISAQSIKGMEDMLQRVHLYTGTLGVQPTKVLGYPLFTPGSTQVQRHAGEHGPQVDWYTQYKHLRKCQDNRGLQYTDIQTAHVDKLQKVI